MLRADETHWHCINRDCGKAAACEETERDLETRVCDCGGLMKREAPAAVFAYLNFLWDEASCVARETKERDETPCEN